MAVSFAITVIYILATRSQGLAGDEVVYNEYGENFRNGKLWWTSLPFGIDHASAWKAPGYPAWVGFWYSVLGASAFRVEMVQALLAPVTVALTWGLGRCLFTPRVAIAAAWIVAGFPLVFEYYGMLFPEALAIPLTLAVLLALGHSPEPSWKRAAAIGGLIGVLLLVRPNSFYLFAPLLVLWSLTGGLRRGAVMTAVAIATAVVVISPWAIRNAALDEVGFIPISVQDGAAYGTFNAEAANDPDDPYAWRYALEDPPPKLEEVLNRMPRPDDAEVRSAMQEVALDYIGDNPASVAEAFFWNGIVRTWDLRSPGKALDEVQFQGRSEAVRAIGLGIYWLLLAAAISGAWLVRRRRELIWPLLAFVAAASITFTIIGGTRYRAPLEPVVALLAAAAITGARDRRLGEHELPPSA